MRGEEQAMQPTGGDQPVEGQAEREVRLLRIAAHDMRGPLANVRSYADLVLAGRTPLEPRVKRAMGVIRRNADRALGMLEDTVETLRLDRGGLPVEPESTPFAPAWDRAQQRSQERAEPAAATVIPALPETVPPVYAEPDRLHRVLYAPLEHLLSRAQEGSLEIHGRVDRGAFTLTFVATDPEARADRPFGPARRMLEEKHLEDPVRLDLARRLVEAWGGELSTYEETGGGRGFRLVLLLAEREDGQLLATPQEH